MSPELEAEFRARRRADHIALGFSIVWAALCVAAQVIVLTH